MRKYDTEMKATKPMEAGMCFETERVKIVSIFVANFQ